MLGHIHVAIQLEIRKPIEKKFKMFEYTPFLQVQILFDTRNLDDEFLGTTVCSKSPVKFKGSACEMIHILYL